MSEEMKKWNLICSIPFWSGFILWLLSVESLIVISTQNLIIFGLVCLFIPHFMGPDE